MGLIMSIRISAGISPLGPACQQHVQVNATTKKRTRRESAVWADVRHAISALSHPAPVVGQLTL